MNKTPTPFGMLFEEQALNLPVSLPASFYEPVEQYTLTVGEDGKLIPLVLASWDLLVTRTVTEIKAEVTDSDPTPFPTTMTETHVRAEKTDSD